MDGLRPRIDLRPGAEVPVYPEDDVDANPRFNKYPGHRRSLWRGQIGCPARSLPKYVPRSTVKARVMPVSVPVPVPSRLCR